MSSENAIAKLVMNMFEDSTMLTYYRNLHDRNGEQEINERAERIHSSEQSMCKYYKELKQHLQIQLLSHQHLQLQPLLKLVHKKNWILPNHKLLKL